MSKRAATAKIKVWILDHHPVVVAGLRSMMANHPDIKVAATANHVAELPRLPQAAAPDVVIVDMNEPGVSGATVLKRLARQINPAKVLVFSSRGSRDAVLHMVKGGVGGYLLKMAGENEIVRAVKSVGQGDAYLGQKAMAYLLDELTRPDGEPPPEKTEDAAAAPADGQEDAVLDQKVVSYLLKQASGPPRAAQNLFLPEALSHREAEVLALLGKQLNSREIGQKLGLSPRTVDTHRNRIREKLGLPNQDALRYLAANPRHKLKVPRDKPPAIGEGKTSQEAVKK